MRKNICFWLTSIWAVLIFINSAYGQIGKTCEGSQFHTDAGLVYIPKGRTQNVTIKGVTYSCEGCGSCTRISSGAPYGKGLNLSQQVAVGIFGAMIQGIFSGMFDDLVTPPRPSIQDTLKKQQEEEFRKHQEMKKQALARWLNLQAEAEAKRRKEEAEKKAAGEKILAQTSIGGEGLKLEPVGGGKLTPFSWSSAKTFTAIPSTQYETSKFTEMEKLLCSAYFSKMAESAAKSGDLEGARFYGSQMDGVIQGLPTAIECKAPKELASTIDLKKAAELNRKLTQEAKFYREAMPKIEKLREIERKMEEINVKREEAEKKIKELDLQIKEIKEKVQPNDPLEKKTETDDLLAQAMALKEEAEKQKQGALEAEEKLLKEKQNIENELVEMKDKIAKGETKQ